MAVEGDNVVRPLDGGLINYFFFLIDILYEHEHRSVLNF
jgi:hypothetical protein